MDFPFLSIFLLICVSAFFSATETSFFSLSKVGLKELEGKSPKAFRTIKFFLEKPTGLVATVLIGNECANVLISNILANYYGKITSSWILIIALNMVTALPIIFLFGEITPKIIAAQKSLFIAKYSAPTLWFFYRLFLPIRILIEFFINALSKILGIKSKEIGHFDVSDFLNIVEDSKHSGAIGESEKELIENIFELEADKAMDIATPLTEHFSVHRDDLIDSVVPMAKDNEIYRIPVIGDFPNEVVGVLYTKDLLPYTYKLGSNIKVSQLMKSPLYISPDTPLDKVFKRLRQTRVHIAFLESDQKSIQGIITMEDILEHIFGEIWENESEEATK